MNPDCNPIEQQTRQDRLEAAYLASGRADLPKGHPLHSTYTGLLVTSFPSSSMKVTAEWLPTGEATRALGVSPFTLKRYADRDCFLIEGKHFRHGPHRNSPRIWDIAACREALTYLGRLRKQEMTQ